MATKGRPVTNLFTRLLDKIGINETTDCWEWTGCKNNIGYGFIRDGSKMRTAHRVSYELHNDTKIPKGLCVCHTCDNPLCVNPAHLWLGTRHQNMQDMMNKGRGNRHSRLGEKQPKSKCPHCERMIANCVFNRFHNDNCKLKP